MVSASTIRRSRQRAAMQRSSRMAGVNRLRMPRAPPRTGGFYGPTIRRSINERKTIDVDPASYVCDTTGSVTLLNGVATGTDFTDRIGRKITIKSLYLTGFIAPTDDTITHNMARIIVVYDMQTNGAAPVVTDVLKSSTSTSQINLQNRDRFRILIDKRYCVAKVDNTATQTFSGAPSMHKVQIYKRLNLETLFGGTAATVGSIQTGSIYLITIGSAAANAGSSFTGSSRVRFLDS